MWGWHTGYNRYMKPSCPDPRFPQREDECIPRIADLEVGSSLGSGVVIGGSDPAFDYDKYTNADREAKHSHAPAWTAGHVTIGNADDVNEDTIDEIIYNRGGGKDTASDAEFGEGQSKPSAETVAYAGTNVQVRSLHASLPTHRLQPRLFSITTNHPFSQLPFCCLLASPTTARAHCLPRMVSIASRLSPAPPFLCCRTTSQVRQSTTRMTSPY